MDRRLTTIVAADLAGYSRLMAADEEGTIARLRSARSEVIDPAVSEAGGRIVKSMGDGLLIEFPSPVAAVRCLIGIQEATAARETGPEDQRLRFRVGLNLGDVVQDGDDILGDGVNVAARLESLAPPGGICVSRSVHEQLRGKIDKPMTALGPQMVKNIPDPVEVWRVEVAGATPAPAKATERPSIVVLPFDNMSNDPDQDFLADGIVEDVTTELSRFRSLFVIARNSAFAYKGTHKDVRDIARDLGVRYVVEGSVRSAGQRLRVTAQLIEAATGNHVWAERWDRTMQDLFDLQDELTSAIVTGVEPELGAHERKLARQRPSENLTAWELCQRGLAEQLQHSKDAFEAADAFYRKAIDADPGFALPHAMRGRVGWSRIASGFSPDPREDVKRSIASVRRALELDGRQEVAQYTLGVLLAIAGEPADGMTAVDRAVALNPNNAQCHYARSMVCLYQPSPDGLMMQTGCQAALQLSPKDPMATMFHFLIGLGAATANGYHPSERSVEELETACSFQNTPWFVFMNCAVSLIRIGRKDSAGKYLAKALQARPGLSVAAYLAAFPMPIWQVWCAADRDALEELTKMGLPRE